MLDCIIDVKKILTGKLDSVTVSRHKVGNGVIEIFVKKRKRNHVIILFSGNVGDYDAVGVKQKILVTEVFENGVSGGFFPAEFLCCKAYQFARFYGFIQPYKLCKFQF